MALTAREIEEENEHLLRRRAQFRRAAERATEAFAHEARVVRVALIGSVAKAPWKEVPRFRAFRRARVEVWHECKDVDLAVWVDGVAPEVPAPEDRLLRRLRRTRIDVLLALLREENIGVATHQMEVFFLEPGTDRYLGRLCDFSACPKRGRDDCFTPGCGAVPFLKQHEGFRFFETALDDAIVLYDRASTPTP